MAGNGASNELAQEISNLASLPRVDLVERWQGQYGVDPPKGLSTLLLIRAVAYEIQARAYGGLKAPTRKRLERLAGAGRDQEFGSITPRSPSLDPGARLVREWNGETHVVDVTGDGFEWQDQQYGSLSEIARLITGARWSGPRFFGLNGGAAS